MKKGQKLMSVAAIASVAAGLMSVANVSAMDLTTPTWPSSGSSIMYNRNITSAGSVKKEVTFKYSLTLKSGSPTTYSGLPTTKDIAFNGSDTWLSQTIDFSGMKFSSVGDYEFTLSEISSSNAAIYPLASQSYTVGVSVRNNADLTGLVASFYGIDQAGNKVSSINEKNKSFIFSGKANYTKIEIKQTVSGNAGDKEKCFEYKFAIDNSTEYNLKTSSVCNNSSKIANGGSVYMRKDDVITIGNDGTYNEIPEGSVYSFTKVGDNDYVTTWDGATTSADNSGDKTMVAVAATDYNSKNVTTVNREKNIAVNTGVVMGSIIYIILAIAGVAGLTYMIKSKKNA